MSKFDAAAVFLLDMQFPNLFEPASAERCNFHFRCKGCQEIVSMPERAKHFRMHVREREREQAKRQRELTAMRVRNMAKARAARAS